MQAMLVVKPRNPRRRDLVLPLSRCAGPRMPAAPVVGHPGDYDPPQHRVRLPVTTTVEPVAQLHAGGGIDRAGATERREARLAAHPVRVVYGRHHQGAGDLGGNAMPVQQALWQSMPMRSSSAASSRAISAVSAW